MSRPAEPISIPRLADSLSIAWDARDVVTANGSVFRLIRVEGMMDWHHHEEDQLFVCWDGTFTVELAGSPSVELKPGDVFVIPRGTEHMTHAKNLAHALMSIGVHTMARP